MGYKQVNMWHENIIISFVLILAWMLYTTHLNKAWVNKWKKANPANPKDMILIIKPNCLKVDKAMIFFKSNSKLAPIPAINIVNLEINNKKVFKDIPKEGLKRINKYTPAVTNVEECTKADTGVGAAIAAGNQDEKGIWALLVIAAKTTIKVITVISNLFLIHSK